MYSLSALGSNFPLMMALLAWFLAQLIKFILTLIVCRENLTVKTLLSSGGMPSSHTATVCALSTSVAMLEGLASPLFAACVVLSFIVMYDAMGVRRETGIQAKLLNDMLKTFEDMGRAEISAHDKLKEFVGHTPLQVLIGAILGILIACLFYLP